MQLQCKSMQKMYISFPQYFHFKCTYFLFAGIQWKLYSKVIKDFFFYLSSMH